MELSFRTLHEPWPGPVWAEHCARVAAAYEGWYFSEGDVRRPTYLECETALRTHMPEMVPLWSRLVALAGGGDRIARMLSLWRPPAFMAGCSQVLWSPGMTGSDEPALIRNYDYELDRCDGVLMCTAWSGPTRRVIASLDSLWGALDGINEHGLAVSLAFGGRKVLGEGFGIPLLLRYVLELCENTEAAVATLRRLPCHMCYTVGVIDRRGAIATVFLNPDRPARVEQDVVSTNHQGTVEWPAHAEVTGTVERHDALQRLVDQRETTVASIVEGMLTPPLHSRDHARHFATLYTAVYRPARGTVELHWPTASWRLGFDRFAAQTIRLTL